MDIEAKFAALETRIATLEAEKDVAHKRDALLYNMALYGRILSNLSTIRAMKTPLNQPASEEEDRERSDLTEKFSEASRDALALIWPEDEK
ncbi:hypothetical protein [Yoonia sp. I 8.24]|uniref:hypothetical protein n=1 Tax=Yoonia sp. I 8.24 TaxID=1537229 RepID=UPI001EDCDA41|nr:hypothetical protein [Yoonia sp. I 8.24]MCG3267757.1 hypothetical protein [Yoonia sp. I 8.24]